MPAGPPAGAPAKKAGPSGCLIAVFVLMGVTLLGGGLTAFFVFRAVSSPEGQRALKVASEGIRAAKDSQTAPGTAELRAVGCAQAQVLDLTKAFALLDAGAQATETRVVICLVDHGAKAPACDDVARTYVTALGGVAPSGFAVEVGAQGGAASCSGRYKPDGLRR